MLKRLDQMLAIAYGLVSAASSIPDPILDQTARFVGRFRVGGMRPVGQDIEDDPQHVQHQHPCHG